MNYKILTEEYERGLFNNYYLTDLMLLKKKNRNNKTSGNQATYLLLNDKLEQYGMQLFGQFERNEMTFRGLRLLENFPLENEPILKQLYGFKNFLAHIQLRGFDDFALAFDYNVDTGECELQKHCWGSIKKRHKYETLSEMLNDIKEKGYEEVFEDTYSNAL